MADASGSNGRRRRSPTGAVALIVIGAVFLMARFIPGINPWPLFARFWPLILIFLGLGMLADYMWAQSHKEQRSSATGVAIALLLLTLLFLVALWRHPYMRQRNHMSREVDAQGAQSVHAQIEMPAGTLHLSGGSAALFDGDFDYSEANEMPQVNYNVDNDHGNLDVTSGRSNTHFVTGPSDDIWNLRLNDGVPTELAIDMGAGTGNLRLGDLNLTGLEVNLGAGTLNLDLEGSWKQGFHGDIEGGVGTAIVQLPKDVGVRVHAEGGIGTIRVRGLNHNGDNYENDALGKSPVTIDLNVQGGVGTIILEEQQ